MAVACVGKYLFPVRALSKVFRANYCALLKTAVPDQYAALRAALWAKAWVVYAKRPFGSPKAVVEYLGRYTHKIAISNHRIGSVSGASVSFSYKDYRQGATKKEMTLGKAEFIRRFALHVLPKRFVKIRHYGILSSTWKRMKLSKLQEALHVKVLPKPESNKPLRKCPCCKTGNLHTILVFDQREPPAWYLGACQNPVTRKG